MKKVVSLSLYLIVLLASATSMQAQAQDSIRPIPVDAKRADFEVLTDGWAKLDGKTFRLSPAVQIRDSNNLLVLSQSMRGRYPVRVQLDSDGSVFRVWILTADEAKKK